MSHLCLSDGLQVAGRDPEVPVSQVKGYNKGAISDRIRFDFLVA